MSNVDEMSFEDAIKELETVVGQLERGDVALDESIALYERGAHLCRRGRAKRDRAFGWLTSKPHWLMHAILSKMSLMPNQPLAQNRLMMPCDTHLKAVRGYARF